MIKKLLMTIQSKRKLVAWFGVAAILIASLPLAFYSSIKGAKNVDDVVLTFSGLSQQEASSIDFWAENRRKERIPMNFSKENNNFVSTGNHIRSFSLAIDRSLFGKLQRVHLNMGSFDEDILKSRLDQYFEIQKTDNKVVLTTSQSFHRASNIPFCNDIITWKGDDLLF